MPRTQRHATKPFEAQLLHLLIDTVTEYAIFTAGTDGVIRDWNPSVQRLFGYFEVEFVGSSLTVLFTPEDIDAGAPIGMLHDALTDDRSERECLQVKKNGTIFWSSVVMKSLRDESGSPHGFALVIRDQSILRKAPEAVGHKEPTTPTAFSNHKLVQTNEFFKALLENVQTGIVACDANGVLTLFNNVTRELHGLQEQPVASDQWAAHYGLYRPDGVTLMDKAEIPLYRALEGMNVADEEMVIRQKDGTKRNVIASGQPIYDASGQKLGAVVSMQDITARKQAESALRETQDQLEQRVLHRTTELAKAIQALRQALDQKSELMATLQDSERFHRAIAEISTDYAFGGTIEPDGSVHVDAVTEGFVKFYGLTLEDVNERGGWGSVIHPDDHSLIRTIIEGLMQGRTDRGELRGICRDGSVKWQCYLIVPVQDPKTGQTVGLYGAASDITATRQLTEKMREANSTLRSFYDTAPIMMGVVEVSETDILHITDNAATYRFFGIAPDSMNNRWASDMGVATTHISEWLRHYRQSEQTGQPVRFEYMHETLNSVRWLSAIVYYLDRLPNGRCRCSYVAEDVTERMRVAQALRDTERQWRDLAEALPNLVWTDLPDGQCNYLSSQWKSYTGIPESELLGMNWLETVHPDDRNRTRDCWLVAVADKGLYDLEFRIRRYDGQYRWFKTRGVPIRDEHGRIVKWFGTCTDIQDQKLAVEALSEADRRKDEFLATLAHELRNPLAPIRNSLQILKIPGVDEETLQQTKAMMERQVHTLIRLVDDLMDVSRVMRGRIELRKEPIELAIVVARAVETAQPLIDAQGHRLDISIPPDSLLLEADPVRLVQIVGNLLSNSAKYTEPHGQIWVTAERDGDAAILKVRDTGIGIAPELLPHVFELFVQADHASTRTQGGLGIGLTIVKNLVEMHAGTIDVQSGGLGRGTEFVMRLPLMRRGDQREFDNQSEPRMSPNSPGYRILVVDDNKDASMTLAVWLRLQGHELQVVHDGISALEMAQSFRPHLIFLDLGMPVMDGFEVARRLREQPDLKNIVIAALSGWGQEKDRRLTSKAGIDFHLVKPLEPKSLENLFESLNSRFN